MYQHSRIDCSNQIVYSIWKRSMIFSKSSEMSPFRKSIRGYGSSVWCVRGSKQTRDIRTYLRPSGCGKNFLFAMSWEGQILELILSQELIRATIGLSSANVMQKIRSSTNRPWTPSWQPRVGLSTTIKQLLPIACGLQQPIIGVVMQKKPFKIRIPLYLASTYMTLTTLL